jgi:hypothetical protein
MDAQSVGQIYPLAVHAVRTSTYEEIVEHDYDSSV